MSNYIVYTDGAFSSSRNKMGVGIVFLKDGCPILEYSRMYYGGTNNKAEMAAVIIALRLIKNPIDSLTIVTDSMYVIGCATKDWKRKKNVRLWQEFDIQYERVKAMCPDISFEHVKGHNGNEWNEYCDKLAVKASQSV